MSNSSGGGEPALRRSIGLGLLVLYGLGTTIGAGIYVLIGEIARVAGSHAPLAFLGSAVLAGLSAGAFAELSARFPRAAGEAHYIRESFASPRLALVVGLLIILAGCVSAAAIANGFGGYLEELWGVPGGIAIAALVIALAAIAAWGIGESIRAAGAITLVEIGGLLLVLWATHGSWATLPRHLPDLLPPMDVGAWRGIGVASVLAFYAFLGFEDIVNVAEEVERPSRTVPLAIGLTLVITAALYAVLATAAVLTLPPEELGASGAPLATLYARGSGGDPRVLGGIALLAVVNGALIQIIMASRVLYGLSVEGELPVWLGRVHPYTRTPLPATFVVGAAVLLFALLLPLVRLAEATSYIALVVFTLVNAALIRLHRMGPTPPGVPRMPRPVPILGAAASGGVLVFRLVDALM